MTNRQKVPDGYATTKTIDCSLKRWGPLTHFMDDGNLAEDNNRIESPVPPPPPRIVVYCAGNPSH